MSVKQLLVCSWVAFFTSVNKLFVCALSVRDSGYMWTYNSDKCGYIYTNYRWRRDLDWMVGFMVLNVTFNNISVFIVAVSIIGGENGVPGENYRPVASHWQIYHIMRSERNVFIQSVNWIYTKGVIRSHKSKKVRQDKIQHKKDKSTKNDLQNNTLLSIYHYYDFHLIKITKVKCQDYSWPWPLTLGPLSMSRLTIIYVYPGSLTSRGNGK